MEKKKSKNRVLDKIDREMIGLLQKDGRIPIVSLARQLSVSETTARTRLNRLLKNEVINIVAVSNPIKLGFEIIGSMKLNIDLMKKESVIDKLKKIEALNYIALTTGGTDIDVEFIAGSLDEFKGLVFDQISAIDGIKASHTFLIVEIFKDTWDYGTAWD